MSEKIINDQGCSIFFFPGVDSFNFIQSQNIESGLLYFKMVDPRDQKSASILLTKQNRIDLARILLEGLDDGKTSDMRE